MRLKVILPIIGLAAGLASCGKSSATPTQPTPTGQTQTQQSKATITIPAGDPYYGAGQASSFTPGNVTIAVGGTVTWSNKDGQVHNTTSDSGLWKQDIAAGGEVTQTFSTKGTFAFHCAIHAGMTGTVTVQ